MRTVANSEHFPPSRPSDLRQANARFLLRLIQTHNPCSRADLVRYSGLTAPTVTSCVALLEKLNLVEAIGNGESNGGRPPGLLRFNAKHGYVAAVDIGGTHLRMMLSDLGGTTLNHWSHVLQKDQRTPEGVCALVGSGLKELCRASGVARFRVLHLTAGAPGITDASAGIVLSAPNLTNWNDVPLRSMLQAQLDMPVIIENDTNLAAVGEHLCGAASGASDFVFLALGTGFGAGIFIDGRLHHGANWSAGEVGYFGLGGKARQAMRISQVGQLEAAIGGGGIEALWRDKISRKKLQRASGQLALQATQILDLAAEGNRTASSVAESVASLLADAIADIAALLNPQIVILGGGIGSHPELCRLTRSMIMRHELTSRLTIRTSTLGAHAQLSGAISMSLEAVNELILPK